MASRRDRITRETVAALKRRESISDASLPGFIVRRPRKFALYGVRIRLNGGQRLLSIGTEAEFTPDQARGEAERIRGLKRQGRDPAAERDRQRQTPTMKSAADKFMAEHVRPKLRTSTAAHMRTCSIG